jgi:hypothetical protein
LGLLWPCPQILRPDWKRFPMENHLADWASLSVMKKKSFIKLILGLLSFVTITGNLMVMISFKMDKQLQVSNSQQLSKAHLHVRFCSPVLKSIAICAGIVWLKSFNDFSLSPKCVYYVCAYKNISSLPIFLNRTSLQNQGPYSQHFVFILTYEKAQ